MAKLICDISMSVDGFVAGPNPSLEEPLGAGGELLHEWAFAATSWRERHGLEGGEKNADSDVIEESLGSTGAVVMGRKMFSGGAGPWENDPRADGWWGDDPPFHVPVFVLTHHARETKDMQGGTRSTSSPTASKLRSSRPVQPQRTRTSCWPGARAWFSSTWRQDYSTSYRSTSRRCSWAAGRPCSTSSESSRSDSRRRG
jgi:dihydrofolate reductase